MPIYRLGDRVPDIHPDAFVHPEAVVIGSVSVGAESSIWPGTVLRADHAPITIGAQTSIQDGTVVHTIPSSPTKVGDRCVVGHMVHLEGCTLEDDCLVGSGSVVLHRVVVSSWAVVGANAVVNNDGFVPSDAMALGVPYKIRENVSNRDLIRLSAEQYVRNCHQFKAEMERIG